MIDRPKTDLLSQVANVAGVGSLIMAVASGNLEKLSELQRWGLASAAVVTVWFFMMTALVKVAWSASEYSHTMDGKGAITLIAGGLVLGSVLLAVVPFFTFGLPADAVQMLSIGAAASFAVIAVLIGIGAAR